MGYFNDYLRKWLGASGNMSNVSLYCDETPCPFKNRNIGGLLQLQQSEDQSVRDNISELCTGTKWKVAVEISNIDTKIKMPKFMGNTQIGRTGLGYIKRRKRYNDEKQRNRREFLEIIRKAESESLCSKAVQQSVQGHWSKLQGYILLG